MSIRAISHNSVEDGKTMQMVPSQLHKDVRHTGGSAVIRNGGQMKVKLQGGKAASEEAILALEESLGYPLSNSFRAFVQIHDGAKPETNIFNISDSNDSGVNEFIPVDEILKERTYIGNIPRRAYPVAWAECGNYVLVDEGRNGGVFYWDHELPDKPTPLARSFGAFLDLLEPFDIKSVQLKPGQVKRVWIDPEFLKGLKKQ